jgi:hypothetical protein
MVAGYDTGSSDILWTPADWASFAYNAIEKVHIDQGGPGAPKYSATVQDVEAFAYSVGSIQGWVTRCTAERPTTYVSGVNLGAALNASRADIWLAAPCTDVEAAAIMAANPRIVAVQNNFTDPRFDVSLVGDPYWPAKKPVIQPPPPKGKEMFNGVIPIGEQRDIPFPVDTFTAICFFVNKTGGGTVETVVVLNAGAGQSTWRNDISTDAPVTVQFPHPHAVAVTLINAGSNDVGYTLI